jgi:hypothetical protein
LIAYNRNCFISWSDIGLLYHNIYIYISCISI